MKLLVASNNLHKIQEMQSILKDHQLYSLSQLPSSFKPLPPAPKEDGSSYYENALLKAQFYHQLTQKDCLADDSGIEIDFFGGAPGLHSSRFLDPLPQQEKNLKILEKMQHAPNHQRRARFVCCIVAILQGQIFSTQGIWEGEIASQVHEGEGFGYDPIFWVPEQQKTASQLGDKLKNQLSHRALALQQLNKSLRG